MSNKYPNIVRRQFLANLGLAGASAILGDPLASATAGPPTYPRTGTTAESDSKPGALQAAVVKADITPNGSQWLRGFRARQSTGVHDHLYHRVVAMANGQERFILASTDVVSFSPSIYDEVALALHKELGITPRQFWWASTHTHSAPYFGPPGLEGVFKPDRFNQVQSVGFTEMAKAKLIQAVKEAASKLEPARLGVGWGMSLANINRRATDLDGSVSLGKNPDGPMDRRIGLIRLDKADGKPLALIANYSMHGTVLGPENLLISADAPGEVAEYVEQEIGAPMLYMNGAAGNLAPIYTSQPTFQAGHLSQFRVLLGKRILGANQLIESTTPNVALRLGEETIETPRKPGLGWPSELSKYLRTTSTGATMVQLPARFLQINNDIVVWSMPVELFCEISMYIRNESSYPYTFYFGYCNGCLGYLPTAAAFREGGYEPNTSPFTARAEDDVTRAVMSRLDGHQV